MIGGGLGRGGAVNREGGLAAQLIPAQGRKADRRGWLHAATTHQKNMMPRGMIFFQVKLEMPMKEPSEGTGVAAATRGAASAEEACTRTAERRGSAEMPCTVAGLCTCN